MDLQPQHENLILQVILNAIKEDGIEYLDTDDAHDWLTLIGLTPDFVEAALTQTSGQIKDIRFINEHLND